VSSLDRVLVPVNREGYKFIAIFAVVTLVFFQISEILGWIGVVLTLWCAYFFRDPDRVTPTRAGLVISPADGVVQMIERAIPPEELGMGPDARTRVSVFMNVFNVHVNRAPMDGEITNVSYRKGQFLDASLDKASEANERQSVRMTTTDGKDIAFVQIAGLVARRILCQLKEGDKVRAGERFGLIRFGSRVDVYLDHGMEPLVVPGQLTVAGETVLADATSTEGRRSGEVR
jgi:phosphatidylserine decarboxylase